MNWRAMERTMNKRHTSNWKLFDILLPCPTWVDRAGTSVKCTTLPDFFPRGASLSGITLVGGIFISGIFPRGHPHQISSFSGIHLSGGYFPPRGYERSKNGRAANNTKSIRWGPASGSPSDFVEEKTSCKWRSEKINV